MAAWQFAKMLHLADRHGWTRFVSMQNHYNLIYREEEREMLPLCREEGIGVIPWSPLARGFLAGNRRKADRGETAAPRPTSSLTSSTTRTTTSPSRTGVAEVAQRHGVRANAGRARLAVVEARRHGPDHRCFEGHSPG